MTRLTAWTLLLGCVACSRPSTTTSFAPAPPSPSTTRPPARPDPDPAAPAGTRYLIDGQPVDQTTWDALLESMSGEQTEWYCDDATWGGEEGWVDHDAKGNAYRVSIASHDVEGSTKAIERIPTGTSR